MVSILALHEMAWREAVGSQQRTLGLFTQVTGGGFKKDSIYRGVSRAVGTKEMGSIS